MALSNQNTRHNKMLIEIYLPYNVTIQQAKRIKKDLDWQMYHNVKFNDDTYHIYAHDAKSIIVQHPNETLSHLLKRIIQGNIEPSTPN